MKWQLRAGICTTKGIPIECKFQIPTYIKIKNKGTFDYNMSPNFCASERMKLLPKCTNQRK